MRSSVGLFIALMVGFVFSAIDRLHAQGGDTEIAVQYRTQAVRVRPDPRIGSVNVQLAFTLKPDGKVQDKLVTSGRVPEQHNKEVALGESDTNVTFRVVDRSTIIRIAVHQSYTHRLMVRVNGKSCQASAVWTLNPGYKEIEAWSAGLGQKAYFSSVRAVGTSCAIR